MTHTHPRAGRGVRAEESLSAISTGVHSKGKSTPRKFATCRVDELTTTANEICIKAMGCGDASSLEPTALTFLSLLRLQQPAMLKAVPFILFIFVQSGECSLASHEVFFRFLTRSPSRFPHAQSRCRRIFQSARSGGFTPPTKDYLQAYLRFWATVSVHHNVSIDSGQLGMSADGMPVQSTYLAPSSILPRLHQ